MNQNELVNKMQQIISSLKNQPVPQTQPQALSQALNPVGKAIKKRKWTIKQGQSNQPNNPVIKYTKIIENTDVKMVTIECGHCEKVFQVGKEYLEKKLENNKKDEIQNIINETFGCPYCFEDVDPRIIESKTMEKIFLDKEEIINHLAHHADSHADDMWGAFIEEYKKIYKEELTNLSPGELEKRLHDEYVWENYAVLPNSVRFIKDKE